MKSDEFIQLEEEYGAHNYHPLDVVIDRGEGVWVYDIDGNKYLDCLSAYSAVSHGHVHPEILEALKTQAEKLTLVSRAFRNDQLPLWYKEISELTGFEMSLPMNSGAEAVETALKLARKWGYVSKKIPRHHAEIIFATGNFHGRTISLISSSTEALYRDDFGPFTPGFVVAPFGDFKELEKSISANTAAILIEPIQGEAGVIVPPPGFLTRVSELCQKNNILMVVDEIQTGLGRTGKLFAYMHEDVRPDIVILGKALSGGFYPVSAVLADRKIMGLLQPGEHGSTFGGNPLAAAVSRAAMRVLVKDKLTENAAVMGEYLLEQLAEIPSKHVKEVRGKGLLIGVELKKEAGGARRFCEALLERNILAKETHEDVIRFAPPLIITREVIDWALPKIREVLLMP